MNADLINKWKEEIARRQAVLDQFFGGGKFGGSVLKAELLLLSEFVADLESSSDEATLRYREGGA